MNEKELDLKLAGIEPLLCNYGEAIETRAKDGWSWYDLSINANAKPTQPDTAIIVTAWMGQLKWLKSVLASYRKSGAFVILAYDNPFYAWTGKNEHEIVRNLPNVFHYLHADAFVMKHITYDGNKRNGWFWNVYYAQGIIRQFKNIKYVYCTNGDCVWDKPEGLKDIKALLGDADFISGQSDNSSIHTAAVLYKVDVFNRIFDWMFERMRVPVIGSHSPEAMLRDCVGALRLNYKHAPKQPIYPQDGSVDMYCCYNQDSTWRDLVGFRNLFAEYETAGNEAREMMWVKPYVDFYFDCIYWAGEERETICQYLQTGDRRYLYKFWHQWEDSDYNRIYYPIDFYGAEPIYE